MDLNKLSSGKNVPDEINVVIEIPAGGAPVKYEIDKESGGLFVDRVVLTSMVYPHHYGFIPKTFSPDGDPCDVLVVLDLPLAHGSVIKARPVGVFIMEDESGIDEKILAVPVDKVTPYYSNIKSYKDFPQILLDRIEHFFEQYKALEKGKWVKIKGWEDVDKAKALIVESVKRAKE